MSSDARQLGWARAALGLVFTVRHTSLVAGLPGIHLPPQHLLAGWPDGESQHRFAALGLALPNSAVSALCVVRAVAGVLFTLGVAARPAGVVAVLAAYLVAAQDPIGFLFTTHILYLGVLVLALGDARSFFALRPVAPEAPTSSAWLVQSFVASVYFWSAIPKLRGPWLSGQVLRAYLDLGYGRGVLGSFFLGAHARTSALATVALELALAPLLLVRRTRTAGVVLACAMHTTFELTVRPDVLGWVMVAMLLAFVEARPRERGGKAGP